MSEALIKLAEMMGYERRQITEDGPPYWAIGDEEDTWIRFDPFADAGHCDLLKKYMQSQGWHIEISWQHLNENVHSDSYLPAPAIYVEIWHCGTEQHERLDTDRGEPYTVTAAACMCLGIPLTVEDSES